MRPTLRLQPRHHLLHPFLPHVGVNLGGGDALVTQQGLDVHQFGPSVQEVSGVSMPQFVRADLLVDAGLLQHPPQVGPRRLIRRPLSLRLAAPGALPAISAWARAA
jgi:hypothetical protein